MPKVSYATPTGPRKVAYKMLRCLMASECLSQRDLAKAVRISPNYLAQHINAVPGSAWRLNECYAILALFGLKDGMLPVVFPSDPYAPLPFDIEAIFQRVGEAKA